MKKPTPAVRGDLMVQNYSSTWENWVCESFMWSFIHEAFMASGDKQVFFLIEA